MEWYYILLIIIVIVLAIISSVFLYGRFKGQNTDGFSSFQSRNDSEAKSLLNQPDADLYVGKGMISTNIGRYIGGDDYSAYDDYSSYAPKSSEKLIEEVVKTEESAEGKKELVEKLVERKQFVPSTNIPRHDASMESSGTLHKYDEKIANRDLTSFKPVYKNKDGSAFAYVMIVFNGDRYVKGAVNVAHSLMDVNSPYDRVCLITEDVSEEGKKELAKVFTHVIPVDYIDIQIKRKKREKEDFMYPWMDKSCIKWNCLKLEQYKKIVFCDADLVFLENCDELFESKTPAGIFSHAWSDYYVDRKKYKHGDLKFDEEIKWETTMPPKVAERALKEVKEEIKKGSAEKKKTEKKPEKKSEKKTDKKSEAKPMKEMKEIIEKEEKKNPSKIISNPSKSTNTDNSLLTYSSNYKNPNVIKHLYVVNGVEPKHGATIDSKRIQYALDNGFVCGASLMVLSPSSSDFKKLYEWLVKSQPYGHNTVSGIDEQAIAEFYTSVLGREWSNIHQRYCFISRKEHWLSKGDKPKVIHYLGNPNPWEMKKDEFPDLIHWWKVHDKHV